MTTATAAPTTAAPAPYWVLTDDQLLIALGNALTAADLTVIGQVEHECDRRWGRGADCLRAFMEQCKVTGEELAGWAETNPSALMEVIEGEHPDFHPDRM